MSSELTDKMKVTQKKFTKKNLKVQEKDDCAIVLDFLPDGQSTTKRKKNADMPIIQAIGKKSYKFIELLPKKGYAPKPTDEVYIGPGKREKIHHVIGKLKPENLTSKSQVVLHKFIIKDDESLEKYLKKKYGVKIHDVSKYNIILEGTCPNLPEIQDEFKHMGFKYRFTSQLGLMRTVLRKKGDYFQH